MTLDRKDASIKDNYNELSKPNICQKKRYIQIIYPNITVSKLVSRAICTDQTCKYAIATKWKSIMTNSTLSVPF